MHIEQIRWSHENGWERQVARSDRTQLVLVFGESSQFHDPACYHQLKSMFPGAHIVGCSSSGSILGPELSDGDIVATAIRFERGRVAVAAEDFTAGSDQAALAARLVERLRTPDLRHILVLSEGLHINGSELAAGFNAAVGDIGVSGGLAGDGTRFGRTGVMADAPACPDRVAAIGFYGEGLAVHIGCFAGWDEFGAERMVTRSSGNVVYEIDGQPALALYKRYLGDQADDLPGAGLRFPLAVRGAASDQPLIRTLLGVDEEAQSLTFAGDVPEGDYCRLMKANLDGLIDSAGRAAEAVRGEGWETCMCVAVSCVGRRLVMGQLTEEELEIVLEQLGPGARLTGFYSYGELAPFSDLLQCQLHNQTMTLTAVYE